MIISIPKSLIDSRFWKVPEIEVYALSRSCIGVAPKRVTDWYVNSLHYEKVPINITPKTLKFKLPQILYNFYNFVQSETRLNLSSSDSGMTVLIIIDTEENPIYNPRMRMVNDGKKRNLKGIG